MKTKYIPKIGDMVRVVECAVWANGKKESIGKVGKVEDVGVRGLLGVRLMDGFFAVASKVEPVKQGRPKKVSPLEKEVGQLPSERIKEIYKKLTANTYVDPTEFSISAIDAIIKYLDEQHKEGKL